MLSELERGKGYVIVSREISEMNLSYNTKGFELPKHPLFINLVLMYKKTEQRKAVLELIDRIRDTRLNLKGSTNERNLLWKS